MTFIKYSKTSKRSLVVFALAIVVTAFMAIPQKAYACGVCDASGTNLDQLTDLETYISDSISQATQDIDDHTDSDFDDHKDWLINTYFKDYILPAMMMLTEQMSAVAMQQMEILGTLLDAKHQLETERLYGQLTARAHKDYQPSENMCTIGTVARSLAQAERNGDLTAHSMAQRSLDRQLMNENSASSDGRSSDRESRTAQFRTTYCDKNDNNKGLDKVCDSSIASTPAKRARINKDIDFTRTLWNPLSLNLDFSSGAGTVTNDTQDILALESNLYAHETFKQPIKSYLLQKEANQQIYLDMRSIVAKRSVAENSFQAIAGMKAVGTTTTANTAKYLLAVIKQLNTGITDAQAKELIGENPSYYAQMEILTKKLIQDPQFFTDLYDTPANVARKGVALQAISLMQDRDYFKSNMRSEAILSVLLELEVANAQKKVQNQINPLVNR